MKNLNKYIAIILLVFISACAGENDYCLGPSADKNASSDTELNASQRLDKFLLESQIITKVIAKIKEQVIGEDGNWGATQQVFDGLVESEYYKSAIASMFILAIVFYGVGVSTGILQVTFGDAVIRLAKIGVITYIVGNWDSFYGTIAIFFINGTDELLAIFLSALADLNQLHPDLANENGVLDIFGLLDRFIALIFSQHMVAIISALFSPLGQKAGPYGLVYALVLGLSISYLASAVLRVVTVYALSIFAKALLFALAPIFLAFMLFNQTKPMFDSWLKQLINYSLQPVIVIAFIGLFIGLIAPLLTEVLQQNVCYRSASGGANALGGWGFVDAETDAALVFGVSTELPIALQTLLLLFFFSWLFGQYIGFAEQIATALTVTVSGNLSDAAAWLNARPDKAGGSLAPEGLGSKAYDKAAGAVGDVASSAGRVVTGRNNP